MVLAILGLVLAPCAHALSSKAGTSGAQFLKLGAGARAGAMAETHLAVADDIYAVYYNPASLTRSSRPMAAGMHNDHFQDVNYDFLAFSMPFAVEDGRARHALGLAVYNLSVADIDYRTGDSDLPVGSFDAADNAYALTYGYRSSAELAFGASVKYVKSKLDTVAADAVGLDLGAQYRLGTARPLDLALVVRNVGTELSFKQGDDPLPLTVGVGAAAPVVEGLTVAVDVMKARDTDIFVAGGAEYRRRFGKTVGAALRGGYSTRFKDVDGLNGLAAGLGLELGPVGIDFAWIPFGDLGQTFRYSLQIKF